MHGLLHVGIEILHAEAQPVESDGAQRSEASRCHGSRIDLDGHLDIAGQIEDILQRRDEPLQLVIRQEGGRTAAEVELPDGTVPAEPLCHHLHLGFQQVEYSVARSWCLVMTLLQPQ